MKARDRHVRLNGSALNGTSAMSFSDVVKAIKALSVEEKQEIQSLLQQYLREERRLEIYEHFQDAQAEERSGALKFSSNTAELKQLIED